MKFSKNENTKFQFFDKNFKIFREKFEFLGRWLEVTPSSDQSSCACVRLSGWKFEIFYKKFKFLSKISNFLRKFQNFTKNFKFCPKNFEILVKKLKFCFFTILKIFTKNWNFGFEGQKIPFLAENFKIWDSQCTNFEIFSVEKYRNYFNGQILKFTQWTKFVVFSVDKFWNFLNGQILKFSQWTNVEIFSMDKF